MKKHLLSICLLLATSSLWAQTGGNQLNLGKNGLAVDGFDVVAYQINKKAVEGNPKFAYRYEGTLYYFYSEANLNTFKKDAGKYVPQYGGWCAYAMGNSGEKVKIDPETFKVVDGKLYLFYNFFFNNTLESWNKNEKALRQNADNNWNKYIQTK